MNAPVNPKELELQTVEFKLDGQTIISYEGETILKAAKRHGIDIPHLCFKDGYRPDGNCRACVVEINGERTLAPSCCRSATPGMEVKANSQRALKSQKLVLEMLLSDMPDEGFKWVGDSKEEELKNQHGELSTWASRMDVTVRPELKALRREKVASDISHPAMAVNLDACIQCNRCVRACREEQVNDVIGYAMRGAHSEIVFDLNDPMGESTYNVKDEKIVSVEGRNGPANHNRLCVKGRFGMDYIHNPQRLTKPLIRKAGVPKDEALLEGKQDWSDIFREATWEEALEVAGGGLKKLKDQYGNKVLAGFGSAKGSNEEAYLFQKLVRTGFGSNNVDHCTRLCHASSVAALLEGVGSGAVSNQVNDVEHSSLILLIGSNPTANHPVAATWFKNAAKRGTKIVLCDPRMTDIAKHAWRTMQFKPDTDVAMLNAMIYTVIEEGLADKEFIANRANNFEALKENIKGYSPEAMAPICGIPAETLREVAREFVTTKSAMILWGMGVSQHVHGTDNARCLIALVSITGQIGKPGSGLHPLRGQNNVQGASDAGLIPMMFPNYQRVDNPEAHAWFEKFWDTPLDKKPGYTVVEIMHKITAPDSDPDKIRGMYVEGENPAMSDPDLNHARH
ncbi:MAG: formate dehydrogenase, partial [Polynucleobacter sp. 32-46-5]